MAIGRKTARLAVRRNAIKRTIRESFRRHQEPLRGLDLVVMTRPQAATLSPASLRAELAEHWQNIILVTHRDHSGPVNTG